MGILLSHWACSWGLLLMITRLSFRRGWLDTTQPIFVNTPNVHGGIGETVVKGELWSGEVHFRGEFSFSFGMVRTIHTRSNDDESSEPWLLLWTAPEKFSYEPWFEAAKMLR